MRAGRQRLRHLKARSSYRIENEYSPETIPQYFQVSVNVLEARKLSWPNPQSMNSYVVIVLGKKKHRTTIRRNMEEPSYREFFVFDLNVSIRDIRRSSLWFAIMEPRCCAPHRILGETNIDLGTVWAEPHHQIYHKWAQLNLTRDPSIGPVGFLKVDVSIVYRGEIQVMPAIISDEKVEENLLLPTGSEQQRANYVVTIYSAFGLPSGLGGRDRKPSKQPSTYVRVSFCGLMAKTGVQNRTSNPTYCEQISLVEMFPNTDPVIRMEVCSAEGVFNRTIAAAELKLDLISHDGDNGFLPTFGPSLLHMYGGTNGNVLGYPDDGPYHRGSLLVSLKTIVPYYQQGVRNTSVESVTPLQIENLWHYEDFCIFCPIFEISMLDCACADKPYGVAITMGEIPTERKSDEDVEAVMSEIKSRKLHYTGPREAQKSSNQVYTYIDLRPEFNVLQLLTRLPDFRFRMYRNNMVHGIVNDLEKCLAAVEKRQKEKYYDSPSELIDELNKGIDNAVGNILKYLDIIQYSSHASEEDSLHLYNTELDHKQLALQKEEIEKIYHQIVNKTPHSVMRLMQEVSGCGSKSWSATKKNVKILQAEVKTLTQNLKNILFKNLEGWPDIIIWLLNGGSRIAYARVSPADIIFSVIPEQCGRQCGAIQTLYFKPIKCTKHINTTSACYCISGKVELLFWMGLYRQKSAFPMALPDGYSLNFYDYEMSVKCSNILLECRVFILKAKLANVETSVGHIGTFVRVNTLNAVKETKVQVRTPNPVWKQVLKLQRMALMTPRRLMTTPPVVLIELYEIDELLDRLELIGRFQIQPKVDDATNLENAPKLQWYEIYRGLEYTGQILMSVQMLQIPELLMKTTSYGDVAMDDDVSMKDFEQRHDLFEAMPDFLIPRSTTYKVDIYWWGLRDVNITRKPCVVLEIDDLTLKSDVIAENKPNCNFPKGRISEVFESLLSDLYLPTLNIRLYDSSTFGRTLFLGTNVVNHPNKYIVNWLSQNERDKTLHSASITSNYFCQINDALFMRIYSKYDDTEDNTSTQNSKDLSQMKVKKSKFKKWFSSKEPLEEEFTLLPVYTKEKDHIKVVKKVASSDDNDDWWTRFFYSQNEENIEDKWRLNNITIYHSELELQPQFSKFKDWCSTLKLYNGKKTGFPDKDEQLHCGYLKAGIAIYRWPPPDNTVVVNPFGVELDRGYFADYPNNNPTKHLIRVYIVKGINLTPKDFSGKCDPYVVINCGKKRLGDRSNYIAKSIHPIFGRMYEFRATLPDDYLLSISLYDYDPISADELIGTTTIDLEDRVYSKHRATVGIGAEYTRWWRDYKKPSEILEELCSKNHLPLPIYPDNTSVYVNGVEYRDSLTTDSYYNFAIDKRESLCLSIVRKWHTLPICGYHLVPEHVETRSLYHPNKPGVEQGKLQLWVDIFPLDPGTYTPAPSDINPRKVEEYELRVIVWDVNAMVNIEQNKNIWKSYDLVVKVWVGLSENAQYTDVHFNSKTGEGKFNWRMIFHFLYHHAERKLINNEQGPFIEYEEYVAPVLNVHLLENNSDEFLGSLTLDLNSLPRGAKLAKQCNIQSMHNAKKVNLFALKSIRAWWPLTSPNANNENCALAGVIDLELTLLPKEKALLMPVGLGRDAPSSLPEPDRPKTGGKLEKVWSATRSMTVPRFILMGVFFSLAIMVIYALTAATLVPWTRYMIPKTSLRGRNNSNVISIRLFPLPTDITEKKS